MENEFTDLQIEDKIINLEKTLFKLCHRYLDDCNSVYGICFYRIEPPDSSYLDQRENLQDGLRRFMSCVLGGPMGGFTILDESKADIISSIGAIPPTQEDLMKAFTEPMLEVLEPLQVSFYSLTDEGELFYDDLLKPVIMSISCAAVCINSCWFILMADWSD